MPHPNGLRHRKATVTIEVIDACRDMHDDGKSPTNDILPWLSENGYEVSINTLNDWLYYRTRCYG